MSNPFEQVGQWISNQVSSAFQAEWNEIRQIDPGLAQWMMGLAQSADFLKEWIPLMYRGIQYMG